VVVTQTSPQSQLSFKDPPLKEVSISVQFEPINGFHIGLMGLTWNVFKNRYPEVEATDELPHEIEKFGVISRKQLGFKLLERVPIPRLQFVSKDRQYLIQLQNDRFIFNWRKLFDENLEYPRYPNVKRMFLDELAIFNEFLATNGLESPSFNQVEVTYVNHIDANSRSIEHVFKDVIDESRFSSSLKLEAFSINLKHLIQRGEKNIGRMYTSIEKANKIADGKDIYVLRFIVRSHPSEPSLDGVTNVMDISREEINNCFSAITTKAMHDEWNKEEV
jgi:uncharacterized protein (TIGR04255 family)